MIQTRKTIFLAMALWAAFTVVVGASFFNRELWSDEAVSLMLAAGNDPAEIDSGSIAPADLKALYTGISGASMAGIWQATANRDNHPPGYATLLAAAAWLIGAKHLDPSWVRVLNIAISALFAFVVVALAQRFGFAENWLAIAIVVFSPFAIYVAREIRAYGPLLPICLCAMLLCLQIDGRKMNKAAWLAAILAVNLLGCLLHKLFIGVVVAEIAYLAVMALTRRNRFLEFGVMGALVAAGTAAFAVLIPNVLTAAPTIGGFETEWLLSPRDPLSVLRGAVVYVAYFASYWITPPQDLFSNLVGWIYFVLFLPLLLLIVWIASRELVSDRNGISVITLVVAPVGFLLALHVLTGFDFSKASRYAVIWVPFAAIWLMGSVRPGLERRVFMPYAAIAVAVSSAIVLFDLADQSTDRARAFAEQMPAGNPPSHYWIIDDTLNTRALLLVLNSELERAGKLPKKFTLVPLSGLRDIPYNPDGAPQMISGPRRYSQAMSAICKDGSVIQMGTYVRCASTSLSGTSP